MAAPTNSGDQSDMASEHFNLTRYFNSPSPPPSFPSLSNSMVVDYQWSGQSSMDNPLQNKQQHDEDLVDPPQNLARDSALWQPPLTPPAPPISRSKPYAGISQRPTNSGESDMATEDLDVMSFLISPQWSPPRSPSSSNSMVVLLVYQRSGQSSIDNPLRHQHQHEDFVDRPLYVAGLLALWRQKLLMFWINESDRRGILTMKKQNLPQSLECLGISLLNLYVEDELYPLYMDGESWRLLSVYMPSALDISFPGEELQWMSMWHDRPIDDVTQVLVMTDRVAMGVWQIGPREWVAKIRYHRLSVPSQSFTNDEDLYWESEFRRTQVVIDDARLHFPELDKVFHEVDLRGKSYDQEGITQLNRDSLLNLGVTCDTNSGVVEEITLPRLLAATRQENLDEDFVNGQVEPVRVGGEVRKKVKIVETPLNSGKRNGKEKTPRGERGNKKTTRVRKVKEIHLKDAAKLLKVNRSVLKHGCREHGINHQGRGCLSREVSWRNQQVVDEDARLHFPNLVHVFGKTASVIRLRGGKDHFDFPSPELFLNKKTEEHTRASRTGIPLLQQENPNDHFGLECSVATGNDEFEALGIGSDRTVECQMAELNLNDEFKAVGTGSESTVECQMAELKFGTDIVIVKAKYEGYTIKFQLSRPWGKAKLEEQVKKRLALEAGTYHIKYKDEEDELILIACDEDLQYYISVSRLQGITSIRLLLERK